MHGIFWGSRRSAASSRETSSSLVSGFQRKSATCRTILGSREAATLFEPRAKRDSGEGARVSFLRTGAVDRLDRFLLDLYLSLKPAEGLIPDPGPERDQDGVARDIGELSGQTRAFAIDVGEQIGAVGGRQQGAHPGANA